jgi:pimeloyl-ACP methyl ester carboxylesterase
MKGLAKANPLHVQAALGGAALSDMPDQDVLQYLRVPTLILAWEDDTAHPVSTATELADLLPDVRDLVICHPGNIDDWESALATFVKKISASETAPRLQDRKKPTTLKRKRASTGA